MMWMFPIFNLDMYNFNFESDVYYECSFFELA